MNRDDLRARRNLARWRKKNGIPVGLGRKTFNLHSVIELLDQVITELAQYSDKEPELNAASESILAAKRLISAYSQRLVNEPMKAGSAQAPDAGIANVLAVYWDTAYNKNSELREALEFAIEKSFALTKRTATFRFVEEGAEDIRNEWNDLGDDILDMKDKLIEISRQKSLLQKKRR